jgi:hypothetical protein
VLCIRPINFDRNQIGFEADLGIATGHLRSMSQLFGDIFDKILPDPSSLLSLPKKVKNVNNHLAEYFVTIDTVLR